MQILLVEDDNTLFQELKKELEQWDFNVVGVEDFSHVMETFETFNPEIVILDVEIRWVLLVSKNETTVERSYFIFIIKR